MKKLLASPRCKKNSSVRAYEIESLLLGGKLSTKIDSGRGTEVVFDLCTMGPRPQAILLGSRALCLISPDKRRSVRFSCPNRLCDPGTLADISSTNRFLDEFIGVYSLGNSGSPLEFGLAGPVRMGSGMASSPRSSFKYATASKS